MMSKAEETRASSRRCRLCKHVDALDADWWRCRAAPQRMTRGPKWCWCCRYWFSTYSESAFSGTGVCGGACCPPAAPGPVLTTAPGAAPRPPPAGVAAKPGPGAPGPPTSISQSDVSSGMLPTELAPPDAASEKSTGRSPTSEPSADRGGGGVSEIGDRAGEGEGAASPAQADRKGGGGVDKFASTFCGSTRGRRDEIQPHQGS